ncbi:MAG: hypothetical protein ACRDE7_02420, partial [Sphingobacterium sp.]
MLKPIHVLFTLLITIFWFGPLFGQSAISGVVKDVETQEPLSSVTVSAQGKSSQTNNLGQFELQVEV